MSSSLFAWYEWGYFSRLKRPLPLLSIYCAVYMACIGQEYCDIFYRPAIKIFSYRDKLLRSLLPTAFPNLYLVKYKLCPMKYSLYSTKCRLCLMLGSSLPWTL